ncbi:poly-beta-hydroxybutyrate polymerase N-terminal domain-containing protein [Roseateles sp. DB2]|uniref:poly-beta-hydroxybutyrate polymerase N-terminal domain-containing protein n=1 Tax=Roseateles sp. DB2 TaxID=3453717 RepID=UPI003EEB528E
MPAELSPDAAARHAAQRLDALWQAGLARSCGGLSPVAMALAVTDWALHLSTQPAQAALLQPAPRPHVQSLVGPARSHSSCFPSA